MHVDLEIITSGDYFDKIGKEIDWDEDDESKVSVEQAEAVQKILTAEVSIYLLRRAYGVCGSLADDMVSTRRNFINEYEKSYEPYIELQDFY